MKHPNKRLFLTQALLDRKLGKDDLLGIGMAIDSTGMGYGQTMVVNLKANPFPDSSDPVEPPAWPAPQAFISALLVAANVDAAIEAVKYAIGTVSEAVAVTVVLVITEVAAV